MAAFMTARVSRLQLRVGSLFLMDMGCVLQGVQRARYVGIRSTVREEPRLSRGSRWGTSSSFFTDPGMVVDFSPAIPEARVITPMLMELPLLVLSWDGRTGG
jgi:hypothetical protein